MSKQAEVKEIFGVCGTGCIAFRSVNGLWDVLSIKKERKLQIVFDSLEPLTRDVVEYAFMPSGKIVVMTERESYWFDSDGKNPKSHLTFVPRFTALETLKRLVEKFPDHFSVSDRNTLERVIKMLKGKD